MQLYAPSELVHVNQENRSCFDEIVKWTHNFLAKSHPDLGRVGPVCPFLPRALKLNTIRLAVIRTQNLNQQQIEEIVLQYRDAFLQQEPATGELAFYKAFMLIFPDVLAEDAPQLIDEVQRKLKPFFVEAGLMIGEFHQYNNSPGLHNPNFYPLRSPVPMLAIRYMAESDLPFLNRTVDDPQVRIKYLEAYLNRLGTMIKDKQRLVAAEEALTQVKTQTKQELFEAPLKISKCPFTRLVKAFGQIQQVSDNFYVDLIRTTQQLCTKGLNKFSMTQRSATRFIPIKNLTFPFTAHKILPKL